MSCTLLLIVLNSFSEFAWLSMAISHFTGGTRPACEGPARMRAFNFINESIGSGVQAWMAAGSWS